MTTIMLMSIFDGWLITSTKVHSHWHVLIYCPSHMPSSVPSSKLGLLPVRCRVQVKAKKASVKIEGGNNLKNSEDHEDL